MSTPNYHLITVRERAWRLLVAFAGWAQVGVGLAIALNGKSSLSLDVFTVSRYLPWPVWAGLALAGGVLILLPRVELVGLCAAALWWSGWSALLIIGVVMAGGPFASCVSYLFITAVHILLAVVAYDERRNR